MMNQQSKKPFTLGMFAILALILALTVFLWDLTFIRKLAEISIEDAVKLGADLTTALFFIIGGISLSYILTGIKFDLSVRNLLETILTSFATVVILFYVNSISPLKFEIPLVDQQYLGVLIGVAEECFFRLFLCGLFWRISEKMPFPFNFIIAVAPSSAMWATFHVARYGGNFNILFTIFLCGCVLGLMYLYTRTGDGVIFGHGVVNYIALS